MSPLDYFSTFAYVLPTSMQSQSPNYYSPSAARILPFQLKGRDKVKWGGGRKAFLGSFKQENSFFSSSSLFRNERNCLLALRLCIAKRFLKAAKEGKLFWKFMRQWKKKKKKKMGLLKGSPGGRSLKKGENSATSATFNIQYSLSASARMGWEEKGIPYPPCFFPILQTFSECRFLRRKEGGEGIFSHRLGFQAELKM